jgi:hypothetical protein
MIKRTYPLTKQETMIYELLETAKIFGTKAALACSSVDNSIQSVAWDDDLLLSPDSEVYATYFPSLNFQLILFSHGVKELYIFGNVTGTDSGMLNITILPDVAAILIAYNSKQGQELAAIAEMAELTTAICDRRRADDKPADVPLEIVDVELQLHCLRRIHNCANIDKCVRYNELIYKYGEKDGN